MKIPFLLLAFCFWQFGISAQKTAGGYVFEDVNNNGKKDRNEKGIAKVAVSNGEDVVITDAKGKYQLPIGDDNIIFVIKPSGFKTPVDDKNLPVFHYNYKPSGSPRDLKYEGISPTGALPQSIDFALVRNSEESDNFRFFAFGDPQVTNPQEVDYFKRGIVDEVKTVKEISFGISLGDAANNNLDVFPLYRDAVAEMGIPWYNVKGNHDRNADATDDKYGDETFELFFGPANYAFQYGKVHFFILDDIISPSPVKELDYIGGLRDDQFKFIENYLKLTDKNDLLIFCVHIPVSFTPRSFGNADRLRFFDLLKGHENVLMLSAHTHVQKQLFSEKTLGWDGEKPFHDFNVGTTNGNWYSGEFDNAGIPVSTMADGTPKGYAIVNIEGNKYTFDYKVAGKPADCVMNIYCPKVVPQMRHNPYAVYVNFFLGTGKDKVEYRIDGKIWKDMQPVEEYDPYFIYLSQRWDFSETLLQGRRPGLPSRCTHLWKGNINTTLDTGEHQIEVRVTDMFGRTHLEKTVYRIEKPFF
ncbi:MAG: calcineurin-like phosphoesterase C-terminal domain-containing protein [Tannerella sp.]|jgi:hypothetical protein|nr:calcineurin-like phosphoesterase C-terminal domain-containing protein [Tannerella sp.]